MKRTGDYWKHELGLEKHPEGGWFKEVYRSSESFAKSGLPDRFDSQRAMATSIYFLLEKNDISVLHRIKSDEIWHFYDGDPLELHAINTHGNHQIHLLGLDTKAGQLPQITIPFGDWFSARSLGSFTLVGCTVAPGFDFHDFEMGDREKLLDLFPHKKDFVIRFTHENR